MTAKLRPAPKHRTRSCNDDAVAKAGSRRRTVCVALGLLLGGLAVYGNSLTNPFIIDDHWIIERDARIARADIWALLTQQYWPGEHGDTQLYRPLTLISFALNRALSPEAWTFRLPNLLLHVTASLAAYLLLRQICGMHWASVLAATLFLVHPIHATVLNQVVDRADLAAAACVLLAAWLYAADSGHGRLRPFLTTALLAVGLLCKENAITLLGLFVLLDLALRANPGHANASWWRRRAVRFYVPAIALVLVYLLLRVCVLGDVARQAGQIAPFDNIIASPQLVEQSGQAALLARWGTPVAILGLAVRLLIWPHPLSWDWSYAAVDNVHAWTDPALWVGVAVLILCAVALTFSYRRRRLTFVALGLMLVTYSVVSNTFILIGSAFADRYLYLPSAGFCMLAGLLAAAAFQRASRLPRLPRQAVIAAVMLIAGTAISASAARLYERNRDFASDATLNAADLRANPRSARLWSAVAADKYNARDNQAALDHARAALAICPTFPDAWRIAGLAHYELKNPDQALACLRKSFECGGQNNEPAHVHAARILTQRGNYAEAIQLLSDFVQRNSHAATARNNLAWYLLTAEPPELRNPQTALQHAREAVALQPTASDFIDTYAAVLLALNQRAAADQVIRSALSRLPQNDPLRPELLRKLEQP